MLGFLLGGVFKPSSTSISSLSGRSSFKFGCLVVSSRSFSTSSKFSPKGVRFVHDRVVDTLLPKYLINMVDTPFTVADLTHTFVITQSSVLTLNLYHLWFCEMYYQSLFNKVFINNVTRIIGLGVSGRKLKGLVLSVEDPKGLEMLLSRVSTITAHPRDQVI